MFIDVLARKDEDSVLTCNTNVSRAITWKFNDYDLEDILFESNLTENGQRLTVSKMEPQMGEYSCWSEGQMLSSVHLLLEAKESGEIVFYFSFLPSLIQLFKLVHL